MHQIVMNIKDQLELLRKHLEDAKSVQTDIVHNHREELPPKAYDHILEVWIAIDTATIGTEYAIRETKSLP